MNKDVKDSVKDFQAWLKQRNPQVEPVDLPKPPKPVKRKRRKAPVEQYQKTNVPLVLTTIKERGTCDAVELSKVINVPVLNAANQLRCLREGGKIILLYKQYHHEFNHSFLVYALPDTPEAKLTKPLRVSIRGQIIEYFKTHETGTNTIIAKAIGKKLGADVATATMKMVLHGELTAEDARREDNNQPYRIFRLAKGNHD